MQKLRTCFFVLLITIAALLGACKSTRLVKGPDNAAIKDAIQSRLFQDATLKMRDIQVDSQMGVVTLRGTVSSDMEKLAVEGLARGAPGVVQVSNQLSVLAPPMVQTISPDEPASRIPITTRPKKAKPTQQASTSFDTNLQGSAELPPPTPVAEGPMPPSVDTNTAQETVVPPVQPPLPPPSIEVTVPSGTIITVRMIDSIDSSINRPGEEFAANLEVPIVVGNTVVIQRGADVRVRLVDAASAGHVKGRSELQLELISIDERGMIYPVQSGDYRKQGASRGKQTGAMIGGAAGLGALIGAAAGGGKGAAIGAAIGAAGGGVATAATKGQQVKIPTETRLDFILKAPLTVEMNQPATLAEGAAH